MGTAHFEKAKAYALHRLERELSPLLTYHSLVHTRDDVVPACDRLAVLNNIGGEQRMLLLTAAYYHDLGFVVQRIDHEAVSVGLAAEILPGFSYNHEQVNTIIEMIMATRLPQTPKTMLEEIIADADLDSLGREDFQQRNQALRREMEAFGQVYTDPDWYINQYKFVQAHRYFTATARQLRDEGKRKNAAEMMRLYQLSEQELST